MRATRCIIVMIAGLSGLGSADHCEAGLIVRYEFQAVVTGIPRRNPIPEITIGSGAFGTFGYEIGGDPLENPNDFLAITVLDDFGRNAYQTGSSRMNFNIFGFFVEYDSQGEFLSIGNWRDCGSVGIVTITRTAIGVVDPASEPLFFVDLVPTRFTRIVPAPEPSTLVLAGIGGVILAWFGCSITWRKRNHELLS